jgi:hypothetical protein
MQRGGSHIREYLHVLFSGGPALGVPKGVEKWTTLTTIQCRYGLEQAYLLQDIVAWKPSVWDRYQLSEEEESFVKVCELSSLFIRLGIPPRCKSPRRRGPADHCRRHRCDVRSR